MRASRGCIPTKPTRSILCCCARRERPSNRRTAEQPDELAAVAVGTPVTAPAQIRTGGFPAYGSHLGCVTANACRMRSSACDTFARLCVRNVLCWPAFPLAPALRSTDSAADCSALFAGFPATMARSDFSGPCIIGYGSSPSRCGPATAAPFRLDPRSPSFRCDPFARDAALDPGRASAPRIAVPQNVAFERVKTSSPCNV